MDENRVSTSIDRHTGLATLKSGFSCDMVVRSPASQKGELPFTDGWLSFPLDTAVWVSTKISEDKNRVSIDHMLCVHDLSSSH
jgi:hypothetical protein